MALPFKIKIAINDPDKCAARKASGRDPSGNGGFQVLEIEHQVRARLGL